MRMRGVDCGPLRRLRRDQALGEAVLAGRGRVEDAGLVRADLAGAVERALGPGLAGALGTDDHVGHQLDPAAVAPAPTAIGVQTPAGQVAAKEVVVELGAEVAHRAGQGQRGQALVVAQRGGRRCRRQVAQQRRVAGLRGAGRDPVADLGRGGASPMRHGIVLPHASSAEKRVRSRARSTTQARSSATTTEPEPMWAPAAAQASNSYGVSSEVRRAGARPTGRRRARP